MKKSLRIADIVTIVLVAVFELVDGINEGAFSGILMGIFLFIIGISYFFEN